MKPYILPLVLLLFSIPCIAQTLIARAGLTSSTIEYGKSYNFGFNESHINGFVVGAGLDFPILKHLAIHSELCFINKGVKRWMESADADIESTLKLNYLELSLLAKLQFDGLYFILGPACGFGVGGTHVAEFWTDFQSQFPISTHVVEKSNVSFGPNNSQAPEHVDKAYDLSAQIGVGYVFKRIQVDFRYVHGFTNIDASFEYHEAKNRVFQLSLGYQLPIKRKNN